MIADVLEKLDIMSLKPTISIGYWKIPHINPKRKKVKVSHLEKKKIDSDDVHQKYIEKFKKINSYKKIYKYIVFFFSFFLPFKIQASIRKNINKLVIKVLEIFQKNKQKYHTNISFQLIGAVTISIVVSIVDELNISNRTISTHFYVEEKNIDDYTKKIL